MRGLLRSVLLNGIFPHRLPTLCYNNQQET